MSYFKVSVYSPSRVLVKNIEASEITVPTTRGEFNILPEHTHLVTQLGTGIIDLKTSEGHEYFSSTSGLCKVLKNEVTILSKTSEHVREISKERAEKALEVARKKLEGEEALRDDELVKYRRKMARAEMRLQMSVLGKD